MLMGGSTLGLCLLRYWGGVHCIGRLELLHVHLYLSWDQRFQSRGSVL